ncbi:hypothetical protein GN956_G14135 [Arapaima gigas]
MPSTQHANVGSSTMELRVGLPSSLLNRKLVPITAVYSRWISFDIRKSFQHSRAEEEATVVRQRWEANRAAISNSLASIRV